MGEASAISWTNHTFNPWWGCQRVSPGCQVCYAQAFDHRLGGDHWGPLAERRFFGDKHWAEPLRWARSAAKRGVRERVFCASMADVFEDRSDLEPWRARLWDLIQATAYALDWLLLTKRPENLIRILPWTRRIAPLQPWSNVWLGTTVEDQRRADERIPLLLGARAALHFLSCEPLLSPVRLDKLVLPDETELWPLLGQHCPMLATDDDGPRIDWVIAGCESGRGARPAQVDWFRQLRDQCAAAGVPFHLKQATDVDPAIQPVGGISPRGSDRIVSTPYLDGAQHVAIPRSPCR